MELKDIKREEIGRAKRWLDPDRVGMLRFELLKFIRKHECNPYEMTMLIALLSDMQAGFRMVGFDMAISEQIEKDMKYKKSYDETGGYE